MPSDINRPLSVLPRIQGDRLCSDVTVSLIVKSMRTHLPLFLSASASDNQHVVCNLKHDVVDQAVVVVPQLLHRQTSARLLVYAASAFLGSITPGLLSPRLSRANGCQ